MSFQHVEVAGESPTLVLLHGTGGTENDLVQLGQDLLPGARIISPRGKVNEHGMNRWFRRFAEGVFDDEDIRRQAAELAEFLRSKKEGPMIGIGYSNGANIGAALVLLHPDVLDGLVMWRGMTPLPAEPQLIGKEILMVNGQNDPMAPLESARNQAEVFRAGGAEVEQVELPGGHGLTQADFLCTKEWLEKVRTKFQTSS
ncbi:MAG: alpha/beta hydrolase [Armatimonadota bacterium]